MNARSSLLLLSSVVALGCLLCGRAFAAPALDAGVPVLVDPHAHVSAGTPVYDNTGTAAQAGYSEPNANLPIFGDALHLSSGGPLGIFGCTLFNSADGGNTGLVQTGSMLVKFYDNTVPYAGGVLANPLLGTAVIPWDLTTIPGGGLPVNGYAIQYDDLSALNINLTQEILVTQQYTPVTGTSTRTGVVVLANSVVPGSSSPANVYIKSTATAEGLYGFGGTSNQFGYYVDIVPEPASCGLIAIGVGATLLRRRA